MSTQSVIAPEIVQAAIDAAVAATCGTKAPASAPAAESSQSFADALTAELDEPSQPAVGEQASPDAPAQKSASYTGPESCAADSGGAEPAAEPQIAGLDTSGTSLVEPSADVPANSSWKSLFQICRDESFVALSPSERIMLLEFWRTGDRIRATKLVLPELDGEALRLASLTFNKGKLAEAVDRMIGKSERDRVLDQLSRAINSRKTTAAQIAGLRLQCELLGLLPKE